MQVPRRVPLKAWLISLPITALLPVVLAIWTGAKGDTTSAVALGIIALLCIVLTIQALFKSNPERRPLALLRYDMRQRARGNRYHVLRNVGNSTYVFVEDSDDGGIVTLWFFEGNVLELMEEQNYREVSVPAHGVRIRLDTDEILHCFGIATLHYELDEEAYSIEPPQPKHADWRPAHESQGSIRGHKRLLERFRQVIANAEERGRRHNFRR